MHVGVVEGLLTLTHSTSEVQGAVAFGAPDLLMLTTARPVCRASSQTLVPTNPLPPKTINFGGPSYVLYRQQRVLSAGWVHVSSKRRLIQGTSRDLAALSDSDADLLIRVR